MGRPKGFKASDETRAKNAAALRRRWAGPEREKLLSAVKVNPRRCPEPGTPERKVFDKVRQILGAAAAHAELRRGVQ